MNSIPFPSALRHLCINQAKEMKQGPSEAVQEQKLFVRWRAMLEGNKCAARVPIIHGGRWHGLHRYAQSEPRP